MAEGLAKRPAGRREYGTEQLPLTKQCKHFSSKTPFHGPTGPILLKTVHWTVFRALDAPEPLPGEGFGALPLKLTALLCIRDDFRKGQEKGSAPHAGEEP